MFQGVTVSLELPECEGSDIQEVIENFKAQACGGTAWVYNIELNGEKFQYDEADGRSTVYDGHGNRIDFIPKGE